MPPVTNFGQTDVPRISRHVSSLTMLTWNSHEVNSVLSKSQKIMHLEANRTTWFYVGKAALSAADKLKRGQQKKRKDDKQQGRQVALSHGGC